MRWNIINACIVTPLNVIQYGSLTILDNKITAIHQGTPPKMDGIELDVNGLLIFPGLINCHDHLLGTYFPRVGARKPYLNWLMWDNDLKSSAVYAERQQIDSSELYLLGGYKNLISGVTSVQDHIPHFVQNMFKQDHPIHIIDKFCLAHSVCSFALPWGEGIEVESQIAQRERIPFITHCSEGFDEETKQSVSVLDHKGALHEQTVLIHGIAFSDGDIDLLAKNQANVVWCPVSNLYMFEKTAPIKKLVERGVNVVLGTDSTMSGSMNVFEEMFVAKSYYQNEYSTQLSSKMLVEMLTSKAAKAMCLDDRGVIEENKVADLLLIKGDPEHPYDSLANMDFDNIALVLLEGVPKYAEHTFQELFQLHSKSYQHLRVANSHKIIDGNVLELLQRIRESVGFHKELPFLPIDTME